ncbi:MAG: hypothetical protein IKB71_11130 [Lentisphaeria bacterium]|nr:hypothetical protein [Lentisphaeria bacterium]
MKLAEKLAEMAFEILKNDGVVITAADFQDGNVTKMQLYFLDDENAVASDVIKKIDLLESGVEDIYVLNVHASSERELLKQIGICDIEDELYIKADPESETPGDDFGVALPTVAYMESIEFLSQKKA